MIDQVQVVTPDQPVSDVEYIEITDPNCRNGWFGQAVDKDQLIELRQVIPEDILAAQRNGQHPPDTMLLQYPGKAVVRPDHPELKRFREAHGNHATFRELKRLPESVVEEQVQGRRRKR